MYNSQEVLIPETYGKVHDECLANIRNNLGNRCSSQ